MLKDFLVSSVCKHDEVQVPFDRQRIVSAIARAFEVSDSNDRSQVEPIVDTVCDLIQQSYQEQVPHIENIQDVIEMVLIQTGHGAVANVFSRYREQHKEAREKLRVFKYQAQLYVVSESSEQDVLTTPWQRSVLEQSLYKDYQLSLDRAKDVAKSVEKALIQLGYARISTGLIDNLIQQEMLQKGLFFRPAAQSRMGMDIADMKDVLAHREVERPQYVYQQIAADTMRQFMLQSIYSPEVVNYHLRGAMHLYSLDSCYWDEASLSLEALKRLGMSLVFLAETAAPPKYARSLSGQLSTLIQECGAYAARKIIIPSLTLSYAPFLEGMSYDQIKQEAQTLFYSCWRSIDLTQRPQDVDIEIELAVPQAWQDIDAIGPSGEWTGKRYGHYQDTVEMFAMAMVEVIDEELPLHRASGFPQCVLSVTSRGLATLAQKEILRAALSVARVNPHLSIRLDPIENQKRSDLWETRLFHDLTFHTVAINMPQLVYRWKHLRENTLYLLMYSVIDRVLESCLQKRHMLSQIKALPLVVDDKERLQECCRIELVGLGSALDHMYDDGVKEDYVHQVMHYCWQKADQFSEEHNVNIRFHVASDPQVNCAMVQANERFAPDLNNLMSVMEDHSYQDLQPFGTATYANRKMFAGWLKCYEHYGWPILLDILGEHSFMTNEDLLASLTALLYKEDMSVQEEMFVDV